MWVLLCKRLPNDSSQRPVFQSPKQRGTVFQALHILANTQCCTFHFSHSGGLEMVASCGFHSQQCFYFYYFKKKLYWSIIDLQRVAISLSRRSSWPRDWTHVSCISRWLLYHWATKEALNLLSILCIVYVYQPQSSNLSLHTLPPNLCFLSASVL